jgi:hypothetical protein
MQNIVRLLLLASLLTSVCGLLPAATTKIWGEKGESWSPTSALPDFSFAGYRGGDVEPVAPAKRVNVKDHGARGDGKTDDTEAVLKAIAAAPEKTVFFPAGKYVLTKILRITTSGTVLQGEGMDRTTLFMPVPLNTIAPLPPVSTGDGLATTSYSWSGGVIGLTGKGYAGEVMTTVDAPAKRGDTTLAVSRVSGLRPGVKVVLELKENASKSLLAHVYRNDAGDTARLQEFDLTQVFTILKVEGKVLTVDRPLRSDVSLEWGPVIKRYSPTLENCGVEQLTIEFPETTYRGHWKEDGFNALEIKGAADCWVRQVRVVNPDSGPFVSGSVFCTLDGIELVSNRKSEVGDIQGHHGISLMGVDCLCTRFVIGLKFFHDLTLSHGSTGNVFSNGRAVDLAMDHHRYAPYENLFSQIDGGEGSRVWTSGGAQGRGRHTAAGAVFWNIKTKQDIPPPPPDFAPNGGVVLAGVKTRARKSDLGDHVFESMNPGNIEPPDLHAAQRARRKSPAGSSPATAAVAAPAQTWTNTAGRSIQAVFQRIEGANVILLRDGKSIPVPLSTLSPASITQAQTLDQQRTGR